MTIALYVVGAVCWGSLVAYFTWTALHRPRTRPRPERSSPLILLYAEERVRRYRRAMKRAGYIDRMHRP